MLEQQKYDVVYAGAIREGFSVDAVKDIFVLKFKLSTVKVEQCFSGKRIILKKSLSKKKAETLKLKLLSIGAESLVVPSINIKDTIKAKEKNKKHQQQSTINCQLNENPLQSFDAINENKDEKNFIAENELNQKIKMAQSMMMEQQLKSQILESKSSPKYNKLIFFLIILSGAIWFLYDLSKNSL